VRPPLEEAVLDIALAPDVAAGPRDMPEEEGAAADVEVADGVAIIQVGLSVAITIILTSSVDVGLPIVAGRLSMVEDAEVALPMIVAVMVRAVRGCAFAIPSQILYTSTSS
jgi:hypothetical protein